MAKISEEAAMTPEEVYYLFLEFLSKSGKCNRYKFMDVWIPIEKLTEIKITDKSSEDLDIGPVRIINFKNVIKEGRFQHGSITKKVSTDTLKDEISLSIKHTLSSPEDKKSYYILISPKNYSITSLDLIPQFTDEDQFWWDIKNKQYAIILALNNRNNEVNIRQISFKKHHEDLNVELTTVIKEKYGIEITEVEGRIIDDPKERKILFSNWFLKRLNELTPNQMALIGVIITGIVSIIIFLLTQLL